MSRIEKIAFISSFWSLLQVKVKDHLSQFLDSDLDVLINQILEKIKNTENPNPLLHVFHMPVFLN